MNEEESLNRAINEPVAIYPYDDAWPLLFEQECSRLLRLFPGDFLAIEHIGSTAVPGLSAKPVIDIMAGVEAMPRADALMEPLCQAKYTTSMEYNASLVGRRWLMRWANGRRTHHLHLMVYESNEWQKRLAFRDALRGNIDIAQQYERNKWAWAAEFSSDREAYTAAKGDFIREVLSRTT
ncbi:GrpB family protein [Halomonas sp. 18071143]|uniref:GrpB family protein n=1 Tax=Halomonas sp. 18071143 TaxID=2855441 RepID=UPI001C44CB31|nr:GrpB family protein [Halomonas sp. 18071143]